MYNYIIIALAHLSQWHSPVFMTTLAALPKKCRNPLALDATV